MRVFLAPFLALGLASLALAQPKVVPTPEEKATIAAIVQAGGKAEIDPKLPEAARVAVKFEAGTDAILQGLKKTPLVGSVDVFDATKCTEKGLGALKELPHLRRLILSKSDLTPARVKAIGQLADLRDLRVPEAGLNDAELAGLKGLLLLEQLDLSDNPLTDKGMATVKTFERLQKLYLSKTGITDKGLLELKDLDGLRTLYVGGSKVTPGAIEKFVDEMPNLRVVR